MSSVPEPVFEAPWHAQLFAVTVALRDAGVIDWPDWTARLGATLARHGKDRALDGGDDYFTAWLETLEALLIARDMAPEGELSRLRAAWEAAYLATPHGARVRLGAAPG